MKSNLFKVIILIIAFIGFYCIYNIGYNNGCNNTKDDYRYKLFNYFTEEYKNVPHGDFMNNPDIQKLFE